MSRNRRPPQRKQQPPSRARRKAPWESSGPNWFLVGGIIIVLIIVAGGGFMFTRNRTLAQITPTPASTLTPTMTATATATMTPTTEPTLTPVPTETPTSMPTLMPVPTETPTPLSIACSVTVGSWVRDKPVQGVGLGIVSAGSDIAWLETIPHDEGDWYRIRYVDESSGQEQEAFIDAQFVDCPDLP